MMGRVWLALPLPTLCDVQDLPAGELGITASSGEAGGVAMSDYAIRQQMVGRAVWVGDDAVGLSVLVLSGICIGGGKDGEQQALEMRKPGVKVSEGDCQMICGHVGEDGKGDGIVDVFGQAGKAEIAIFDELGWG